ncbi:hypothetical protein HJG60_009940 [Phyllostomus discolor]|uniref:Uncharacterized protein n=1 Tax=Phyllostomus discolor TaxID=89673 RepID=A0A834B3S1_9CHIR|nr:hypothetical protein HJG60_009940 [Phyllostomus discolor]
MGTLFLCPRQRVRCTTACCSSWPSAGFQCLGQWGLGSSMSRRKAASDQGTHSPWWWALLRGSASRPQEKPHSVATGENPAGAGTGAVIGLLSGSTLRVQLSSDSNPQVTLAFGSHTKVQTGGGEGGTGWGVWHPVGLCPSPSSSVSPP